MNKFEDRLVNELSIKENNLKMIKSSVFNKCVLSGLLSYEDKLHNSSHYQWFEEVFEQNIVCLSLLESIIITTCEITSLTEIDSDVKSKTHQIVKNIAKRVITESSVIQDSECGSTSERASNLASLDEIQIT
ncbi:hypothetical protein ACPV5T_04680 [Vibrio astriarenae]